MKFLIILGLLALVSADNVRVEFNLQQYDNNGGLLASGKKCGGACDPRIIGYVDTDKPLNAWPGPKTDEKTWAAIFEGKSTDSVKVNKIVSRDVCAADFNKANLRIKVIDVNKIFSNSDITQFECLSGGFSEVATSESRAQWSQPKACVGKFNPDKVRLMFTWRAFDVPTSECGRATGAPSRQTSGGSNSGSDRGSDRNSGFGQTPPTTTKKSSWFGRR
ncbi:hypothetical protein BV898_09024 [Hypsibius exemplaris]|uniref:Secreted protein n=1 Tax=Hypsibius exemplaris TaxID=2072580 RepID=A0A1W0WNV9_HYPEX|nr:hypothetical protein BV898_09024 [Hypsibius exemplaris]